MGLEQTAEKEMIPLIFLDMLFDGKARYKRLDNGEVLFGRVKILMQDKMSTLINYSGEGTIKMEPELAEANALLFPKYPDSKKQFCLCYYCRICPEEEREDEETRSVEGFTIPAKR